MSDIRSMDDSVRSDLLADLADVPCSCESCSDAVVHGQRVAATYATDGDDARLLLQMLGLAPSPEPRVPRRKDGKAKTPPHQH